MWRPGCGAVLVFRDQPVLLGTAMLAYGFGLRHAVDADHIAAIDNVTRKLMQAGQRPIGVGLFFALGHSCVVIVVAALVAATATAMTGAFDQLKTIGSIIGTGISALFLFLIAAANLAVLRSVCGAPFSTSAVAGATRRRISTRC